MPALTEIAETHWFPPVRDVAKSALDALKPGAPPLARPSKVGLEIDARFAPDIVPCASGQWRFGERIFGEPNKKRMKAASGAADGGEFSAMDNGEWGGGVWWSAPSRAPGEPVVATNSEGVETASTGAVGVFGEVGVFEAYDPDAALHPYAPEESRMWISNGPSGYGYVLSLMPGTNGTLRTKENARLPRAADVMATIGPDLFAAWSGGRAVVFSLDGIRGLASCVAAP
jgi:hypothetical protein